jgi:exodeoxyribonuclease III
MKIISWNVNGIRAAVKKGFLDYVFQESPDVLCLQEVKAFPDQLDKEIRNLPGYQAFWNPAQRPGYSGVATFIKSDGPRVRMGLGIPRYDEEGRVILADFGDFSLFNVYFPNGQKDDERLQYKMDFYDDFLVICNALRQEGKQIIVCGDFNTAHHEIDLAHPKANEKTSGFLPIERAWMDRWVSNGYVDTFRHFNKNPGQYSWWSYRANARAHNVGWRLDYHFVSKDLLPRVQKSFIQPHISGSDHCPIVLEIGSNFS